MFNEFMTDRVKLIKSDGRTFDNLPASVQAGKIFTNDPNIPIEEGDVFERQRSGGIVERFRVIDAGFMQGSHGIKSHFQTKVEKLKPQSSWPASSNEGDRMNPAMQAFAQQIAKVANLKKLPSGSPEFRKWSRDTEVLVTRVFGDKGRHLSDLRDIDYSPAVTYVDMPKEAYDEAYRTGLDHAVAILTSFMEEIDDAATASPDVRKDPTKVAAAFLVHGHDEAARESVARFLEKLGVTAIILHEQANQGRTIIEKLEDHANVDFAVVLLTPDDVGAKRGDEKNLQPRARQNVVLELGYFVGKLGRKKVCALHKGTLELPSDYMGVVYVQLDESGGWRVMLARELKAAGFNIDLNKVM